MSKISTYSLADTPLSLSDRLIGTEAFRTTPTPTPLATKNFSLGELLQLFSANFPAASLQAVLNTGNTATQNINLTGTIDVTLIKPDNIEDTSGSQGTVFQYLSKGASSINWVDLPIDTLQAVLNAGNTATQNITLVGDITTTKIIPGNIQDDTAGIGTTGQFLSKTASGIRWVNSPATTTPTLGDVVSVGNTANQDIFINGLTIGKGSGTGATNTALGSSALLLSTTGYFNVATGAFTLTNNTTGNRNTALGYGALYQNLTGNLNVAIGSYASLNSQTGLANVALGYATLNANLIGSFNTGLGYRALFSNLADKNTAVGTEVMFSNTTGTFNTVVGQEALRANLAGSFNSIVGNFALLNAEASYVSALGRDAGRFSFAGNLITASESIFVGYNSKSLNTSSINEIVIGANAVGLGNNTIVLGSDSIVTTALTGNVGIGTKAPLNVLDVVKNQSGSTRINIENTDAAGTSTLRFTKAGGAAAALFENASNQFTFQNATNSGTLRFQTTTAGGSTLTALTVDSNQNIEINNNLRVTGAIYDSTNSPGTAGQFLASTVTGTDWVNAGTVTSIGMTVPSAFNVTPSTITSSGTFAITGAGVASQYVRGDGTLANFPTSTGGGASVSYYLNGSISQGTIGGVAYKEMNSVPVIGTGTDFTINADGYIAQFITDVGDPNKLLIPGGNWTFETYFSASSGGGSPSFYIELYKYNGTTFTLIASNSTSPENITGGTSIDLYFSALAVPPTTLTVTDRLAVRFYVIHNGRTITMHTENSHLSQVITTFSSGLTALNGLTSQVQYFAVGTSGTDFNISSATDTHTFNLPTASAANRGALSSADWTAFNSKANASGTTNYVPKFTGTTTLGNSQIFDNGTNVGIGTLVPSKKLDVTGFDGDGIQYRTSTRTIGIGQTSGEPSLYWGSGTPLTFFSGSERMRIDASGNLGLGVTPSAWGILNKAIEGVYGTSYSFDTNIPTAHISSNAFNNGTNWIYKINAPASRYAVVGWTGEHVWYTAPSGTAGNAISFTQAMTLKANGNLGIGTTAPTFQLDVNRVGGANEGKWARLGSIIAAGEGSGAYPSIGYNIESNVSGFKYIAGDFASWIKFSAGGMQFNTAASGTPGTAITVAATSMAILQNGNVGIGDTVPSDKLVVNGRARINGTNALAFGNNAGGYAQIAVSGATTGNLLFSTYDGAALGERMRISTTGNVGIGTTSPSSILDVQSAAAVVGPTLKVSNTNAGGGNLLQLDRATNSRVNGINFSTAGVEDWSLGVLRNGGSPTQVFSLSYQSGHNINSTGFAVTSAGNVGIGTSAPGTKLEVVSSTAANTAPISIVSNSSSYGAWLKYAQGNSYQWYTGITSGSDFVIDDVNIGTTRLIVKNTSGNVGIGVTSPISKFQSSGTITIGVGAASTSGTMQLLTGGASPINNRITYGTDGSGWKFAIGKNQGGTVTDQLVIQDNGNIGIGTTTPGYTLDVTGSIRATQYVYANDSFVGNNLISISNNDLLINKTTAYSILLYTNGTEKMRINSAGNVGIGTTAPTAKLDVNLGNINLSNAYYLSSRNNANTANITLIGRDTSDRVIIDADGYGTTIGGGGSVLINPTSGNVGIGTSSPAASARLDVTSTTSGFLPPRMTNAQRLAIATPAVGLMVYCTDATEGLYIYKSTGWTFII